MRELNVQELELIGGAGIFHDFAVSAGSFIGYNIGLYAPALVPVPILSAVVSQFTKNLGAQIGEFIGGKVGSFVESVFGEITINTSNAA